MKYSQTRLLKELIAAAEAFKTLELWNKLDAEYCFAIVVPGEEHPMVAAVTGQDGIEYGLSLYRGEDAARNLYDLLTDVIGDEYEACDTMEFMGFSFVPLAEIPPGSRAFLKKAGMTPRRESIVPFFLVNYPGKHPRGLNADEVKLFIFALKAIVMAHKKGLLNPQSILESDSMLTLITDGDPIQPELETEERANDSLKKARVIKLERIPNDLRELPRLPERWLIADEPMPIAMTDDDRSNRLIPIINESARQLISGELVTGGVEDAAQNILDVFRGNNFQKKKGIPSEIVVNSRALYKALIGKLSGLGVSCKFDDAHPLLESYMDKVVELFEQAMDMGAPSLNFDFSDVSIGPEETDDTPEDEDVAIWLEANKEIRDRAFPYIERLTERTDSPKIRFFGDLDAADYFMREYEDDPDGVLNSYYEWLVFDFRRGKKSETIAEKILKEEDLPERARELIEAKAAGRFSVFRFEEQLEDNNVKLLDIVCGDEVIIYESIKQNNPMFQNRCVPAKITRLGKHNYMGQMGPEMGVMEVIYCLDLLEEKGMELTREGMKKKSHLFGRSWDWKETVREVSDDMAEYAEDDIYQAVYDVADETSARKAVEAIPEVSRVDDGFYNWLEEPQEEPDEYIEEIGFLSFREGRLHLAAWSEDNFDFMLEELENIPGITLKTTAVNPEDEESDDDELDDISGATDYEGFGDGEVDHERVESAATAEKKVESNIADAAGDEELDSELGAIPEDLRPSVRNYLRVISEWPDSEHPLLDDTTPRKWSRTLDGKAKVTRIIRAMPHFIAISSNEEEDSIIIKAPREEMMKTMGLE